MHILSTQIQYMRLRRARMKQTRTALHMLALSGVVRPSHVELRYTTPVANTTAFRAQAPTDENPLIQPVPLPSWEHRTSRDMNQTWQWVRSLPSAFVHLASKPILFQWNKQVDL